MKIVLLNLKQALRNMRRNAWQMFFAVLGLSMGVVYLAYSLNWLWNETHLDRFRPGYRDLYIMNTWLYEDSLFTPGEPASSQMSMTAQDTRRAVAQMPQGTEYGVMTHLHNVKLTTGDGTPVDADAQLAVSATLPHVAGMRNLAGDAVHTLERPEGMVITRSVAMQYFGSVEKALGATVHASGGGRKLRGEHDFTVGAVVDDAQGFTNLHADVMVGLHDGMDSEGENEDGSRYVNFDYNMLVRTAHVRELQEQLYRLQDLVSIEGMGTPVLQLVPLRLYHMQGRVDLRQLVYPLAFAGLSALFMASAFFNYMALLTGLFLGRLRQYALRVSMGASATQCALWLLSEVGVTLLLCALCAGVGMEWMCRLAMIPLASQSVYATLWMVFGLFALAVLGGAMVPVMRVRRLCLHRHPAGVSHMGVSHTLLLVQVAVCCLMLSVISTGYRQMHRIFTADLGFRTDNILRVDRPMGDTRLDVLDRQGMDIGRSLRDGASPAITNALAMHDDIFGNTKINMVMARSLGITEKPYDQKFLTVMKVPFRTYGFFGLRMKEGRWFREADQSAGREVILNPEALEEVHLQDYATRRLQDYGTPPTPLTVAGILSFRTQPLFREQDPMVMWLQGDGERAATGCTALYVKHRPGMEAEARRAIRATLQRYGIPDEAIHTERMGDYVNRNYHEEQNYLHVFTAIALASLVITLTGVLSMILYTLRLQRRGIAIRRVYGADFATLCRHYLRAYVAVTAVAAIVALPAASHLSRLWLEHYSVRIAVGWVQPVAVSACVMTLVAAIVALQVWRAMREEPATVIKEE